MSQHELHPASPEALAKRFQAAVTQPHNENDAEPVVTKLDEKDPFLEARKELARASADYIGGEGDITDEVYERYAAALRRYFTTPAYRFYQVIEKLEYFEREMTNVRLNGELCGNPDLVWLAAIRADLVSLEKSHYERAA